MPYITSGDRLELDNLMRTAKTPGELNYEITKLLLMYLADTCPINRDPNYTDYNAVIGVLESCKLEFYRRAVAPYEDVKIKENGDVY